MDASVNQEGCKVIDYRRWSAGIAVILFVFAGALCGSPEEVPAETRSSNSHQNADSASSLHAA